MRWEELEIEMGTVPLYGAPFLPVVAGCRGYCRTLNWLLAWYPSLVSILSRKGVSLWWGTWL